RGALVARAAGKHIPVFIGADHHAAHPELSRLRDLLAELDPQSAFRVSRLDEFFQAVAEGAKAAPLAGELRWSYRYAWTLQGVHALASEIVRGSVHDLAHHDPDAARARPADAQPTLVLWNPAARPRRGVALADVTLFRRDVLVGPPGGRVPRMGEGYRPLMLA